MIYLFQIKRKLQRKKNEGGVGVYSHTPLDFQTKDDGYLNVSQLISCVHHQPI